MSSGVADLISTIIDAVGSKDLSLDCKIHNEVTLLKERVLEKLKESVQSCLFSVELSVASEELSKDAKAFEKVVTELDMSLSDEVASSKYCDSAEFVTTASFKENNIKVTFNIELE